jgi:hypothetical protein
MGASTTSMWDAHLGAVPSSLKTRMVGILLVDA